MKYKLTIIKYEDNPNYEAELAKWKEGEDRFGNRRGGYNQETLTPPEDKNAIRSLEVFLTEEEFKKVKTSVIEVFE